MSQNWTFGQKLGMGFVVVVALTVLIGTVGILALRSVVDDKDKVISGQAQNLITAERLKAAAESKTSEARAFLLAKDEAFMERMRTSRADFLGYVTQLREKVATAEGRKLIDEIERKEAVHQAAVDKVIAMRKSDAALDAVSKAFHDDVRPRFEELSLSIKSFVDREDRLLTEAQREATDSASRAVTSLLAMGIAVIIVAVVVAFFLTRTLTRQVGSAVQHIQSSSSELQAAANQQVTGTKEQVTAMNEITTTITELLATSRQIAESAQRVAKIAEETASGASSGDQTVQKAQGSFTETRKQMDAIVNHMLDLGKKSQQIGGVLEIINELAEQTNILAINATIEAAGAGEAGKRFAMVADEIRKLADRVGASTKEIRGLIDETRSAVSATVMVTEGGSKAVDSGARQFGEVATSFNHIAGLVETTTDAAREIELSTKQQATAVEQVKVAISNVAQASKETETSSAQTLQTASELAALSQDLARLVQANGRKF